MSPNHALPAMNSSSARSACVTNASPGGWAAATPHWRRV